MSITIQCNTIPDTDNNNKEASNNRQSEITVVKEITFSGAKTVDMEGSEKVHSAH